MSNIVNCQIDENIIFEPSKENPLSSESIIVKGKLHSYVFDVGEGIETMKFINENAYDPVIILSHFHKDHIGNLERIENRNEVFGGKKTVSYIGYGKVIDERIVINDGVKIEIINIQSSHAKGSLIMLANDKHLFLSDSTYTMIKGEKLLYNTNDLKSMIETLKTIKCDYAYIGHKAMERHDLSSIIKYLEGIYARRNKRLSFIEVSENELI